MLIDLSIQAVRQIGSHNLCKKLIIAETISHSYAADFRHPLCHKTTPSSSSPWLVDSTPNLKCQADPSNDQESGSNECRYKTALMFGMQVARELPRDWKLDTPDAQHLLAELLRDLPTQGAGEEGGDLASSPFLLGLDRSHAQLCSPSSTQPGSLAADSPEQPSQASAISPVVGI